MSEPVLSADEVDAALAEQGLAWERVGDELVTTVELRDFAAALAFVNAVGAAGRGGRTTIPTSTSAGTRSTWC